MAFLVEHKWLAAKNGLKFVTPNFLTHVAL